MSQLTDSFGRCILDASFLVRFYDLFTAVSPEIRAKFAHTDMAKQRDHLRIGLSMMIAFAEGKAYATPEIGRLSRKHGPEDMQIPAAMFEAWLGSLIQAVSVSDPKFSPELEEVWRSAMRKGVQAMTARPGKDARSAA